MVEEKLCPKCENVLPAEEFFRSKAAKNGLSSYCKTCSSENGKLWKANKGIFKYKEEHTYIYIEDADGNKTVSKRLCSGCGKYLDASYFGPNKTSKRNLHSRCKDCGKIDYYKAKYGDNYLIYYNKFHLSDPILETMHNKKDMEWYKANKADTKRKRISLRLEVFNAYGGSFCQCCGEDSFDLLTLDHEYNDGKVHRKEVGTGYMIYKWLKDNNYPQNLGLRVYCYSCNFGRRGNNGICPHERSRKNIDFPLIA